MGDRFDVGEAQRIDDRFKIAELLLKAVGRVGEFIGRTEPEEIERNYLPPTGNQVGNQIVVDVQIIRKTVHKHEGRPRAFVVSDALRKWRG
jgi:hypothetical protein